MVSVFLTLVGADMSQSRIVADTPEYVGVDRNPRDIADASCYPFGLIVAAAETASPMQGYRHDIVHPIGEPPVLPVRKEMTRDVACQLGIVSILEVNENGEVG